MHKKIEEMTKEEQLKTPLGHLYQAIIPLCLNRGITDKRIHEQIVFDTMRDLDRSTKHFKAQQNGHSQINSKGNMADPVKRTKKSSRQNRH